MRLIIATRNPGKAREFEQMLRPLLNQPRTLADGLRPPMLPLSLRVKLPLARAWRGVMRRLRNVD